MQCRKERLVAAAPALAGLSCLLVISILFLAPVSDARRQTAPPAQTKATKRPRAEIVPGEVLVRFKEDKTLEGSVQLTVPTKSRGTSRLDGAPELVALRVDRFEGSNLVRGLRLAHSAAADTWKAIAALRSRADVLYAEPNYLRHADNTPNDPSFSSLYGMTKIAAPQAWDLTTGSSGIVVGVVDEGIQIDHTDLQANIWTNPSPGSISGISGDLHGYDFINNSGTIPPEGHATHVSGTIGAVGNNGVGVVGVNWQSSLMSLRFINEATNSGSDADAIRALNYAKQMRDLWISSNHAQGANVRVLNNSYGGGSFSQAFLDAISALNQSDILFVAAAGNDAQNNDIIPHYPANFAVPNVISVAATDSSDQLANFSDYGLHSVLLGAPGVGILSTVPGNSYGTLSGTSMATPHVAGAAALLLAANPNLNVTQLRSLLAFNGDVVGSLQGKTVTGRRLNVFKSLQALNENDTTPPGTVGSFQITSQSGRTINLSWTASGDDGASGQASLYDISFVDGSTSAVIPLTNMTPAASGTLQTASVTIPYRHPSGTIKLREFDNVGNEGTPSTVPVSVPLLIADPYVPSTAAAAALSTGGTAMAMNCDDCLKSSALPFTFPFFGTSYNSVTVSSNGNIYFVPPAPPTRGNGDADDVPSSTAGLSRFRMIAGMWDDLDLRRSRRADADVFVVQSDSTHVIFRWQGVQFGDGVNGDAINFEIELSSDGTIKTRYGSGNTNLLPVVGISGGAPDAYVVDSLTSEQSPISLTNASSAIFTPRILSSGCPASFTVNSNADTSDAAPGDGVCATAGSVCTLRAAIEEANMLTCGPIDINFSSVTGSITLNSELPAINHNVNINGPGPNALTVTRSTASGTPNFRVFTINNDTVSLSGLTISGGKVDNLGGGIQLNGVTLTLTNIVVTGNTSNLEGGGIFQSGGTLTLTNTTISGNSSSYSGGGISISGGSLTLTNSSLIANFAGTQGGGVDNHGTITLTTSTVSDNMTFGGGGGIYNGGSGSVSLTSSTVCGNSGTGIFNFNAVTLKDTLIAGNTVGGSASDLSGTFNSQDYNLIGNTSGATFTGTTTHNITNVNPLLGPLQNNGGPTMTHALLPGSPAIDAGNSALTTDQRGQPRPVDDPIVANTAGGNGSDIGAYESHNLQVNSLADTDDGACTDASTGNGCTLREAINTANVQTGAEVITFTPALTAGGPATITLLNALPSLSSDVTIAGPGANLFAVQRGAAVGTTNFRIFYIDFGKTVTISGLTIANGNATGGNNGGGVLNNGTLTMSNCNVYGNTAIYGGGIYNDGTSLTLNSCNIGGMAAGQRNNGEGIRHNGGSGVFPNSGTLQIDGGSISGNTGTGIIIVATATLNGVAITHNENSGLQLGGSSAVIINIANCLIADNTNLDTGGFGGGGINLQSFGPTTLTNCTVSGNTTAGSGGGIRIFNSNLTLTNVTITNNRAAQGGGIGLGGSVLLKNTIVAGNFRGASPSTTSDDLGFTVNPSSSFNLIGSGGSGGLTNGVNNNQVGVTNPQLGPLANNGGPTFTHALLPGSPAIDAGDNSAVSQLLTDQRGAGFNRIADGYGNGTATVDIGAYELQGVLTIDRVNPPAGRTAGGQQITLYGAFTNLSTVTIGGNSASWSYTNAGDISSITVTTPAHAVGAVQITLTPTTGSPYSKANAFAYLPTVFTDDTIVIGQTTAKAQHIIELRQAVDALRAVAGLSGAPWTDPALAPGGLIKATHIIELRMYLDDVATRLGYSTSPYTDPGLTSGFMIKRIHIEELRQRIRTIAG